MAREKTEKIKNIKAISPGKLRNWLTFFQLITSAVAVYSTQPEYRFTVMVLFILLIVVEWVTCFVFCKVMGRKNFELETIAFFLSGVGLTALSVTYPKYMHVQFLSMVAGIIFYAVLLFFLQNLEFARKFKIPVVIGALGLLGLNLVLAKNTFGAYNWIEIGSFTFQPSEFVKIAFIFIGAATLEKIQSTKHLTGYIIFSMACIGALFLMRDFGTACIFFFTFLVIAFMRSGDWKTILMICGAAVLGACIIISFKPYVAKRFAAWGHVWEQMNEAGGYQQTRTLIAMSSGGFLGVGFGNGKLKSVAASTTDLMFGVVCEEWGLLFGMIILAAIGGIAVYTIANAGGSRSSFYSIAACAAAGLFVFQTCLNVFGITDILPLTGVTLPFVSRGGSSMISSWGLLAFIKAIDIRTYPKRK